MLQKRILSSHFMCVLYSIFLIFVCSFMLVIPVSAESVLQLQTQIADYRSVLLQWESEQVDSSFYLYRSLDGSNYTMMASLSGQAGTVKCYDHDVKMGKTYYYKIVQMEHDKVVGESEAEKVKVVLPTPTDFKTKVIKKTRVQLTWNKVQNAYSYTIYRSTKSSGGFQKVTTVKGARYVDYDVSRGVTYYYKIVANHKKKKNWQSQKSSVVSAHLKMVAPAVIGSYVKNKIKLTWKEVKGADSYYVYKENNNGKFELVKKTSKLYYNDGNVKKGKSYTYKVLAIDKVNGSVVKGDACLPYTIKAVDIDPNQKMVALTYDDGPGIYTEDIVNCLKANQAKATFFVLGCNVDAHKKALVAADEIGCEIGNHTYGHLMLSRLSEESIRKEITQTDKKIENAIGKKATIMRPPGGDYNNMVAKTVGKPIIMWSIDTRDWEHRNSSRVYSSVMNNVKDGDIILMHDIHKATRDASMTLIPRLRREGYQLVTVSELAQYRGYSLEKGKAYHRLGRKATKNN